MPEQRMCLCGKVDLAEYDSPGSRVTGWASAADALRDIKAHQ